MTNYIAWSKDWDNLERSSSGGIFYELAKETLKRGGLVVGVIMDARKPVYVFTKNINVVKTMQGSKYLRARIDQYVLDYMEKFDGPILFVGTSCTINRMKFKFQHKKWRENEDNILYITLRCHGVIKQKVFERYMERHKTAAFVKFRHKGKGWRNSTKLCITNFVGSIYFPKNNLIRDYIRGTNIEEVCKTCKHYNINNLDNGDITLGDYWECPSSLENKMGTSKVVTVTPKGQKFFDSLRNIHYREHCQNKVAIMGGATIDNNGSLIMTQNFIHYLAQKVPGIGFTLLEYERSGKAKTVMKRILPADCTNIDYGFHSAWGLLNWHKLLSYVKSIKWTGQSDLEKQTRDCETVVYLGGDHFVGGNILRNRLLWSMRFLFTCWDFRNIRRAGKKLYLVSQTMGPFPFYIKPFAKWGFSRANKIYVRDRFSLWQIRKLGLTNVELCADLAFLPLYNEGYYKNVSKSMEYTILVVSDLWKQYCDTKDEFIDKLAYIANTMNKTTKLPVLLMAHSCNLDETGETRLMAEVMYRARNREVTVVSNNAPVIQRGLLGQSALNVSLRMHASLSSLEQGVPVIPVAYSVKYGAIYSDLGLHALVAKRLNMLEMASKINKVWKERKSIKRDITMINVFRAIEKKAMGPIEAIAREIKKDVQQ